MSNDKKNGNGTVSASGIKGGIPAATPAPEAKKELTGAEKVALFEAWEKAHARTLKVKADAEKAVIAALDAESAAVETINLALGGSAKQWKGKTVYPVQAGRGGRFVMRGEAQATPEVIG